LSGLPERLWCNVTSDDKAYLIGGITLVVERRRKMTSSTVAATAAPEKRRFSRSRRIALVVAVSLTTSLVALVTGSAPARAANTAVTLTPIAIGFPNPIGIDYYQPTKEIVMSVNYPGGIPNNFDIVAADGTFIPYSSVSGLTNEVYMAGIRSSSCQQTFQTGELYFGTGTPGVIAKLSADGTTLTNPWVTLPNEGGLLSGGLFQDVYCVAGGDLIVTTRAGDVWRVTSAGVATEVASSFGQALEGPTTVPDNPARYGPWAGQILVSDETNGVIWSIDPTTGITGRWDGGGAFGSAEGVHVVPPNQNFFGVDFADGTLQGAAASQFTGVVGDVVLATESPGKLLDITWNGTSFESYDLLTADVGQWEGTTFAPASLPGVCCSLTVTKVGSGSGTVTSSPSGIDCGATCTAAFTNGTMVTLTATPDAGSTFTSWGGDCTGAGPCTVTMDQDRAVTATFDIVAQPGPRVLKQDAVASLQALLPTGDEQADSKIQRAIHEINETLEPQLWLDDSHLTHKGKRVFHEEKEAARALGRIGNPPTVVAGVVDSLVAADQTLARIAIDEATAAGGDPGVLAEAETQMQKAAEEIVKGHLPEAIEHYGGAWKKAQQSLM
jgi:List-Bact-rpt repeat protein